MELRSDICFKSTEPEYDDISFTFDHRHLENFAVAYDVGFSLPSNCFCAKRAARFHRRVVLENEPSLPMQERGGYHTEAMVEAYSRSSNAYSRSSNVHN